VAVLGAVLAIAIWLWVQYLPGYFASRVMVPGAAGLERHLLAILCGFCVTPFAFFMLANFGGFPMDAGYLFLVAGAVNVAGVGMLGARLWREPDIGRRDTAVVCGIFGASALFVVFGFRAIDAGDVLTSIQHCLYVIALHGIHNDPSVSVPLYDASTDSFMHFLIHHDTSLDGLGELLYEQRIANVPILGVPIATLGMAGWFVSALHSTVLTALALLLACRRAGAGPRAAAIATAVFIWGSHVFCAYYVNENYFALAMVAFLLWVALETRTTAGMAVLIGIVCGQLVGIRHPAVLFLPAAGVALLWQSGPLRTRVMKLGLAVGCSIVAVAPWLYINQLKLGAALTHPKIQADSGGRVINNVFMGKTFLFKPLQWPFSGTDGLVRTVWNPFPTFVWLPLLVVQSFGQIALALGAVGTWIARRQRRTLILLTLFAVPHSCAIALLEGVDWEQITYAAPGLAPLAIVMALGIDALIAEGRRISKPLIAFAVCLAVLTITTRAVRSFDLPVDMRLLDAAVWPTPPERTPEIQSVADRLTAFAPLPQLPHWRTAWARRLAGTLSGVSRSPQGTSITEDGKRVYPSGQVVVLSAYSKGVPRHYEFSLAPRDLRTAGTPFRTAVWLHTMAFQFAAERLDVRVVRMAGRYRINLVPVGQTDTLRDFTFWLNPWYPPIESIAVTLAGEPYPEVRVLPYAGRMDEGERLMLVSNYPATIVDTIEVSYEVDPQGRPTHCGIWIFLSDVDGRHIETLSPGGAMDLKWSGKTRGKLVLPKPLLAEEVVLFSEPYCSDHIPQHGDRFGVLRGPFGVDAGPMKVVLDSVW